jgi:alpha-tubulin suppressor-like RCC1 family protein
MAGGGAGGASGGAAGNAGNAAGLGGAAGSGGGSAGASAGSGGGGSGGSGAGGTAGATQSATGIDLVAAGEYVTSYLKAGRLYVVAQTLPRLGVGDTWPKTPFPPAEAAFPADVRIVDAVGGLHLTVAVGDDGRVWTWGDTPSNPELQNSHVPVHIAQDDTGQAFSLKDATGRNTRSIAASTESNVAVKGDGTVWIWGDCSQGRQGDGTSGSATVTKPKKVSLPLAQGVTVNKVVVSKVVHALDSSGGVWSWGAEGELENLGTGNADFRSPHRIETTATGEPMPPIVDIATGNGFSYAVAADGSLYAWGFVANVAGLCTGYCPTPRPKLVTKILTDGGAKSPISSIYASLWATYVILADGSLWAWGSNGQGLVGNGVAPDFSQTSPPYSWNFSKDSMLQSTAVRIAPSESSFVRVYTGTAYVAYAYAQTKDGRLFSWGRNKTGNLGNGIVPLNSPQAATYPNSWDGIVPTLVSPLTAPNEPTSSPQCVAFPQSPDCWCGKGPNDPQGC